VTSRSVDVPKRALLVVSHAMERAFGATPTEPDGEEPGLVIGLFQRRQYFDVEVDRYAALGAAGHTVVVGFAGPTDGMPAGVHTVSFPEHDPRARDWVVVLVRGPYATALVAHDSLDLSGGEMTLEASRLFRSHWTFQRSLALREGRSQLGRVAGGLAPPVLAAATDHLRRSELMPVSPAEARLSAAADHLGRSVERGHRRTTRLRLALETTQSLAERDQLTGLNNRHFLERYLGGPSSADRPVELVTLLIDVDDLKATNDAYGHEAGDSVLTAVATALRAHSRPADVLVRWGGDEFLLLAPGLDADGGLRLGERLARAVRATHPAPPWQHLTLSVSLGVAAAKQTPLPFAQLDAALYRVKHSGKGHAGLARTAPPARPAAARPA
jgi:diguanylate cyclase (GGDEF)-like protein